VAALGLGLAACASDSSAGGLYGGGSTSAGTTTTSGPAAVATARVPDVGTVLVDGSGRTLYLFQADTGSKSTCTDGCAANWPALTTTGDATSSMGVSSSMLGTTTRDDGSTQVTYNGHPLYTYIGDTAAGQANGEGISAYGALWFAVTAKGTPAAPSSGSGGGGGGYGNGGGSGGYGNGYG
jgi:predicted lipoprotein with Yx(FWY)xxD motif